MNFPSNSTDSRYQGRIGFGKKVRRGEIPYQVWMQTTVCGKNYLCGGTLVEDKKGKQWIVTAAHCLNTIGPDHSGSLIPRNLDAVTMRAGDVDMRKRSTWQARKITLDDEHIIIHPKWKGVGRTGSECSASRACRDCKKKEWYGKFF